MSLDDARYPVLSLSAHIGRASARLGGFRDTWLIKGRLSVRPPAFRMSPLGPTRTSGDVRLSTAVEGIADIKRA